MHARDGHEPAERDRADAVLDAVPLHLDDRRREADVERARAQPDGERREEVPGLVDEDQEREAEDRDGDAHGQLGHDAEAGPRFPRCRGSRGRGLRAYRSGFDELSARSPGADAPVRRVGLERVLDERGDLEEADPAVEERGDGDLVRRVEGAGVGAAALAGLAGEREEREALGVRRLELERERRRRSRGAGTGVARALRVRERERDRHAHVRVAEVRERGAVAEADERVDDRGRVHDDLDPVVLEVEEVVRLDQLEPLVRERRRVDGDLRAHRPGGMRERVLHGH